MWHWQGKEILHCYHICKVLTSGALLRCEWHVIFPLADIWHRMPAGMSWQAYFADKLTLCIFQIKWNISEFEFSELQLCFVAFEYVSEGLIWMLPIFVFNQAMELRWHFSFWSPVFTEFKMAMRDIVLLAFPASFHNRRCGRQNWDPGPQHWIESTIWGCNLYALLWKKILLNSVGLLVSRPALGIVLW